MKEFKINEDLTIALLNYLASKPYAEVAQLIQALQSVQPIEEPEAKTEA